MREIRQFFGVIVVICFSFTGCSDNKVKEIIYQSDESGNPEIYSSDLTNRTKIKLTDYELRDGYPAYSPDNKKIAFYAYCDSGRTWSIHIMNADGSDRKRLTNAKNKKESRPAWSPDGKKILFSRASHDYAEMKICVMNNDGTEQKEIPVISGIPSGFTKNGKIIYNTHWEANAEICIADIDGKNIIKLTNNEFSDTQGNLSPDGKKIVFVSKRDGNQEIYIMNFDGTEQKRLTNNPGSDVGPKWSPDGSIILFQSNRDGDWDIYTMNPDGMEIINITNDKFNAGQAGWKK